MQNTTTNFQRKIVARKKFQLERMAGTDRTAEPKVNEQVSERTGGKSRLSL